LLDYVLRDKIHSDKVEVFVIDGIPSLDFIAEKERRLFHLLEPGVMSLRILGGWLSEIPFLSINKVWKSPAELIEQLSSLNLDYTQDDIVGCVKAVLKNGEAFYQPDNIDRLLDLTYNFNDDEDEDEPGCKIYYNYLGKPADLSDDITQKGITNVLKDLRWTF
ncbi:hypothetical protein IJ090_00880, partial [Candidatus Saccharibacteria bacterium]|nr:hypothetical protein [Candidatus Saccharibacteria bacterium]